MIKDRVSAARSRLERLGVDAAVFLHLPTIRYLTGFTGSDGALLLGHDEGWFLTDSRYVTQASLEVSGFQTVEYQRKLDGIAGQIAEKGPRRVGFEGEHTTVAFFNALCNALPGFQLLPLGGEFDDLRAVKDAQELESLARTAEIASDSFLRILERIRPGVVERDLALELEFAMRRAGAENKAFDFIVASGERGALPHGRAGDRAIQAGELVTFDFGCVWNGYNSDETVTVAVGEPDSRQREVYGIVKDAHDRAIESVRPGISFRELDGMARGYIEAQGFGRYFGHGLGHGVGLEVHEKPVASPRSEGTVEEGMVFTVEPGIYIPGWGGVRIEDTVCVTADGCRLLTRVPKGLMVL